MTTPPPRAAIVPYPASLRVFDFAIAALLLVVLAPLLLLLAVLIRLDSPGPALFRQTRVGRGGRAFELLKFRSMERSADPAAHRDHVAQLLAGAGTQSAGPAPWRKLDPDPRTTRVGRILRSSSLDELPQLINVLRGEMSLVGPRPALPYELEHWQPWHFGRLAVPPGITGLWQVDGRGEVDFDDMVLLDLEYIDRLSITTDLSILARTPRAALQSR